MGSDWDGDGGGDNEENWGGEGPRDVENVPWAVGDFFFLHQHPGMTTTNKANDDGGLATMGTANDNG
jgi:hypothetical protein